MNNEHNLLREISLGEESFQIEKFHDKGTFIVHQKEERYR